jgi:hypothetical protein
MNYVLLFWGHSSISAKICRLKKNVMKIILGHRSRGSCRNLFMKLKMLPLLSQYIFSLHLFVVKNRNQYTLNSRIHHINTRQHTHFHQPLPSLTEYQKGTYFLVIKVYNELPSYIKDLFDNPNRFKSILKDFLYKNSLFLFRQILSIKQESILVDFCCNILSVNYLQYVLLMTFLLLSFIYILVFLNFILL